MSISDSQELFLAGLLIYIELRHTALHTTAYLSGYFPRRWWSSCTKKSQACFLNSKIFADFKLDFIWSNLCFATNPILTISGCFLIFCILIKLFFQRNHKPNLQGCQQQKEPLACLFGSLLKMHCVCWEPFQKSWV